jgi:hypothetical protein
MKNKRQQSKTIKISILLLLLSFCGKVEGAREERIKKIQAFVSAHCYRMNKMKSPEMLTLKRTPPRELSPNL